MPSFKMGKAGLQKMIEHSRDIPAGSKQNGVIGDN